MDFDAGSKDEPAMTRQAFFEALRRASRPTGGNSEAPHTEGNSELEVMSFRWLYRKANSFMYR